MAVLAGEYGSWSAHSVSVPETWAIAAKLASLLKIGDVVGLDGELGAGKTHFVQGVLSAWGINPQQVTSPTFTLIQEYATPIPVFHLDAYRLRDVEEFLELGVDEFLAGDAVCLIEWASRVQEVLPQDRLQLDIAIVDETVRNLVFRAFGPRSAAIVAALRAGDQPGLTTTV